MADPAVELAALLLPETFHIEVGGRIVGTMQQNFNPIVQKYFVDASPKELRSHFDVTAREADDRPNSYSLLMIPKRKQIQEGIERLERWIDRTTLMLSAMRMTFPTGDTKLMTFTDVKQNPPIDPAMFTVK